MAEDIIDLTSGLYRFIVAAEPMVDARRPAEKETEAKVVERASSLAERFVEARELSGATLADMMDDIAQQLGALSSELSARQPLSRALKARWQSLARQYEALALHVQQQQLVPSGVHLEHIKPRNLTRNLFHVVMGIVGICLYEFVLGRHWMLALGGSLLLLFIVLEIGRRLSPRWNDRLYGRVFARISRPGEAHRICTSTWYLSGLVLGVWLLPKHAIELGTLVLAFGDPIASLVGKRWGTRKVYADKSAIGTLAFFCASLVCCIAFIWWRIPQLATWPAVAVAAAIALAGAATELFSTRINDNLTIPLAAGIVATLLI